MRKHQAELESLNTKVFVVTFDSDFMAVAYVNSTQLKWPLLLDRKRALYQAYDLGKLDWWGHYNPASIARYLWLTLRGHLPGKPGDDWQQLGGDVLLDPQGIIRLIHRSRDPHDRPSVSTILSLIGNHER